MVLKTSASIVLLTVVLTGIVSPGGVCVLLCVRQYRAESQRHCGRSSENMPDMAESMSGMAHDHSAMSHSGGKAIRPIFVSPSCQPSCARAERLAASRKIVPQVTVVGSGAMVLENATAKFVAPDSTAAWSSDSGPPASPTAYFRFSILRI